MTATMNSYPLSVLDLAPVGEGSTGADALRNTLELARRTEALGYRRYWLAEHHNMPGIASAAPEILIGQVARETSRIRVGSGGIMLPNHAPLKVAEWFLTLEALFPGRIDLGIGRAPGTDPLTARALHRAPRGGSEDLPEQLDDLYGFAEGRFPDSHPFRPVAAMPYGTSLPPIWLLGSSDYSARLAAARGLGFVFAHHIGGTESAIEAMRLYRTQFVPSTHLREPHAILTVSAICAETTERAEEIASSGALAFLLLRTGRPGLIPSVETALAYPYTPFDRQLMDDSRGRTTVGDPRSVHARLQRLVAETAADELMVTTIAHEPATRIRSYELLAEAFALP
jgi:luciferase family oxidoreductase group 1